ncbi:MAG TPA: nucleotidyltransferase family protein [Candidatus Saccharimonadales bacterium]|nr:nucleotidyltransferase family protein [Candidatus Saccharimonadales bacterium]
MTEAGILAEALRLVKVADDAGVPLRLLGGVAFAARVPAWRMRADRPGRDIDLATDRASRRAVTELLEGEGYIADRRYNVANGHKQLYFVDPRYARPVDILIDRMEMCHTFDFRHELSASGPTLPLADLLLSKLQVVRINRKDILDVLILLAEYPVVEVASDDGIELTRVTRYTSSDWGWWRTATGNLETVRTFAEHDLAPGDLDVGRPTRFDPSSQALELRRRIDAAPKSIAWRVRSRVGDRVPWYEEPEEVAHD